MSQLSLKLAALLLLTIAVPAFAEPRAAQPVESADPIPWGAYAAGAVVGMVTCSAAGAGLGLLVSQGERAEIGPPAGVMFGFLVGLPIGLALGIGLTPNVVHALFPKSPPVTLLPAVGPSAAGISLTGRF